MKIRPPIYFMIYLGCAVALNKWLPLTEVIPEEGRLWGAIPLIGGFLLMFSGASLFRKKGTPIRPLEPSTVLVLDGPYRFTRNPMYLGLVTMLTGAAMLLGHLSAFLAPLAMFVTLQTQFIPREERMLQEIFGKAYTDYQKRVRRWL